MSSTTLLSPARLPASRLVALTWLGCVASLTVPGSAQAPAGLSPGVEAISFLGKPLTPPTLALATREGHERRLAEARRAYERTPDNPDSIIWLGRRTAYLGWYRDAIAIFSEGIDKHPGDARMHRHRGHRYITVRQLDDAIADFERARQLVRGRPDEVEPDGLPNARGVPTSTLHSNIRYHLGLAYYLKGEFAKAVPIYREDVVAALASKNHDMLVATSHWLYMALRRLGREAEAREVLTPIARELEVIENGSYHRLLLMYKGELTPAQVLAPPAEGGGDAALADVTVSYGVGNWYLYTGLLPAAKEVFRRILTSPQWAGFGYIGAEAEMARPDQ